jgi:mannan endo-1,4-beta-mannosidase
MLTRRTVLAGGAALLASGAGGVGLAETPPVRRGFVTRAGPALQLDGRPYRYAGTNMWYAAYLGADAPYGNRDRLKRELDRVRALGVGNGPHSRGFGSLAAAGDRSPLRPSATAARITIRPCSKASISPWPEMGRRELKAVIYLTNFWEWSGGMMTYLHWTNGGRYLNMNDPAHPWPEFPDFVSRFYGSPEAVAMYHHYIRAVVTRTNSITGIAYADDPAIMAWQLANEPRPAGSEAVGRPNLPTFQAWVRDTPRSAQDARCQPSGVDWQRGAEGLHREPRMRDRGTCAARRRLSDRTYLATELGLGRPPPIFPAPGRARKRWCANIWRSTRVMPSSSASRS